MTTDTETTQREDLELQEPKKYKVILHNDDYTPFDFVILILIELFNKNEEQAFQITKEIHTKGKGIAGVYTKDIAETKSEQVNTIAQNNEFPLLATIDEE
jgi:ATP-dependent Clp protease adaptor protein ClpS